MTRARWTVALLACLCVSQSCTQPRPPTVPSPLSGPACGEERWAVKTLADPDATRINLLNVTPTTLADLNVLVAHCSGLPDARTFVEEFRVLELTGLVLVARPKSDHDVHLAWQIGPMRARRSGSNLPTRAARWQSRGRKRTGRRASRHDLGDPKRPCWRLEARFVWNRFTASPPAGNRRKCDGSTPSAACFSSDR